MSNAKAQGLCKLASDCLQLEQLKQAKELYDKAIEVDPDCIDAHEGIATIAYLEGDLATSVDRFLKLTLLQPQEARHLTNLGAIYNRMKEHQKAVEVLSKAIQKDKRCVEAYFNLGIAQRKQNKLQLAISAYREATRLNPKFAEGYQNLANLYVDSGNLPMAIIYFKKALEVRPDFDKAREGLKRAERASNAAKHDENPFGRLVNAESRQSNSQVTMMRELSEAERYDDRHEVKHLAEEIERLSKGCIEFLKQKLEPAIIELQRTMADGSQSQSALAEVSEEFHTAVNQWMELRKAVKRKINELRGHEELINAPEVSL
ncbi:tetratricopeptide repeat protein [Schlesneria sp. T3-172]|uniref:tetratricopeptide repeat protein n=1 Tax=Schlesneria sphaerica TaxID=3373610 RepID=UPI0037CC8A87